MGRKATIYLLGKLLALFSLAMLGAAITCHYAAEAPVSFFWIVAGLAAPVVFLINGALLVGWLIRRHWLVALISAAALAVGVVDMLHTCRPPRLGDPEKGDLRVATLNVHGFMEEPARGLSARKVSAMLRDEQVDVACLQEVLDDAEHPFEELAARFADHLPYHVRELSMACFSRYPILSHDYHRFPDSNQSYLRTDVLVGDDTVRLISVHLQTTGISRAQRHFRKVYDRNIPLDTLRCMFTDNAARRMEQVRAVRAVADASSLPLVIAGDFNDTPLSSTYRAMGDGLIDAFRTAGHGCGTTYAGALRIDYIFSNDAFAATDYYVWREEPLSDHSPVIADLKFVR